MATNSNSENQQLKDDRPTSLSPPVEETDVEVIRLDAPKQKKMRNVSKLCANPICGSRTDLMTAPNFVCAFYGQSLDWKHVKRVCKSCYKDAEIHQNILVDLLREKKSLILGPKKPKNYMVTIDDEEISGESHASSEEVEIEEDLEKFVQNLMDTYRFDQQANDSVLYLEERLAGSKLRMSELDTLHTTLEKSLDKFRKDLYETHEPIFKYLEPVDIDTQGNISKHAAIERNKKPPTPTSSKSSMAQLPPIGVFTHVPLKVNQPVYAMRSSLLQPWGKGRLLRIKEDIGDTAYVVRFDNGGKPRTFPLKYIAYPEPSKVQLAVGSRVIAQYVEDKFKDMKQKPFSYYAGVIAEAPKYLNDYRYLVFFDDGYAQYCTHDQVIMVCHSSKDVWHDIHMNSRSFISSYLKQFPERAMVKLQKQQMVKTELNGRWLVGRVDKVDASLAQIFFLAENRHEWIYRGSTRLHPLFELLANAEARKNQGATRPTHNPFHMHKKNAPYVEYTRGMDVDLPAPPQPPAPAAAAPLVAAPNNQIVRAVARKSTSKGPKVLAVASPPPAIRSSDENSAHNEHRGHLKSIKNETYEEMTFEPHQCGPRCIENFPYEDGDFKNYNPLTIPMLRGWAREIVKQRNGGRKIVYRAPCCRRMRNMDEVHRYLRLTGSQLSVDLFCFDSYIHCFTEFEPEVVFSKINDITYGKENVRVSCVNSIDRSNPEYVEYCTVRSPREGVNLNLDENFLVCCDCTDDCQDKEKCQCWQLTIQATGSLTNGKIDQNAGYQYRRLMQTIVTGVYECNPKCACRKTCLNRVVQRPLQLRLQLFKTEKRGWGIRCLDDIPKGEFICVYAGHLLTEQGANYEGSTYGDEYLAELDHIEVVERLKDGYESDVDIDIDEDTDDSNSSFDDDSVSSVENEPAKEKSDDFTSIKSPEVSKKKLASITSAAAAAAAAAVSSSTADGQEKTPHRRTRDFFGPNETIFVMDAKSAGNIGRYLNHCCKPNVFVQNVFVDTQDLRFPWVGFFAQNYIRAGTELTWDYSYDVGSVPDKIIHCYCMSKECRGRLL